MINGILCKVSSYPTNDRSNAKGELLLLLRVGSSDHARLAWILQRAVKPRGCISVNLNCQECQLEMIYFLVAFIVILLGFYWKKPKNTPPGPFGLPIVGYLPWLDPVNPHLTLTQLSKKFGSVYGLFLGSVYTVVVSDHKIIRKLFAKEATIGRAPLYLTHGIMKGYGIICSEKDLWKDQRKFVFSCFKQFGMSKIGGKRETMQSFILKEVNDLIDYIKHSKPTSNGDIILDPNHILKHNVGSTVHEIVFGTSYNRDDKIWNYLLHLQEEGTKCLGIAGPLNFLPFLRFLPSFKKSMAFITDGQAETHEEYKKIISKQKTLLNQFLENDPNYQPDNILHAFLMEKEKRKGEPTEKFYNPTQLLYLLADIFGAGLDTTLTTLRWFFLYMAKHPEIQKKLHEEIDNIIQNRSPNLNDFASMPFAEACFSETQRIRSVVPVGIPHGALEDVQIENYVIPENTMIVPLQWAIHMDEEVWDSPEEFNPNRFLNEEGGFVKNEALIPFQTGKRMCVGDEFARMVMFLFGVGVLQEFFVCAPDGIDLDVTGDCGITLTPKDHELVFKVRKIV
ncbi:cytochrome P450 306a1 isoform X1 [Onthophagus taurus]|uniref:cytochrome P450 306a1 isoform X1 n=2 Tax=Onthophagus taurus TaxID=166361 RepID=UPI0039BE5C90